MTFNDHLDAARSVLTEYGNFIETNSTLNAFPISRLPYEKVVVKNAIIISALEDRSDENIEFTRLAFHILSMCIDDTDANFVNHYFNVSRTGDIDDVNSLDVERWNRLRGKIHKEFAAYENELRQILNQVELLA